MPVSLIPFTMPEPAEIPAHISTMLRQLPPDEAVRRALELLLEIDVAETMVYERLDEAEGVRLGHVVSADPERGRELEESLRREEPPDGPGPESCTSLAQTALDQDSALLVMGQAEAGEETPLPSGLRDFLLAGEQQGSLGFVYVLTLVGKGARPQGALTLIRPASAGPLNHEQPNIAEAVRRELGTILDQ